MRSFTYDGAGNMLSDSRLGNVYAYTYNAANRLKTVSFQGNLVGTYTYNGGEQLIQRVITNSGSSNGTIQYVHDRMGNIIAEATAAGATAREYIWLPEAEIAPTFQSRAQVDRPVAVVDGVNTATPQTWYVATDHLHRPIRMTNAAKAVMWSATWTPWGAPHAITGAATLDARFPGQWFQLESSLHYNWHRHYDPTLGRYTQPDPLGFVDGPSGYGYAVGSPGMAVDPRGQYVQVVVTLCRMYPAACAAAASAVIMTVFPDWWRPKLCAVNSDNQQGDGSSGQRKADQGPPPLPDRIVGNNPRPTRTRTNTDLPADAFPEAVDGLTGGKVSNSDPNNPDQMCCDNGVRIRPGDSSRGEGPRIDIPSNGSKPRETIHFPPTTVWPW